MPINLTDYKVITLDIYGTLVNTEKGIYEALMERLDPSDVEVRLAASSAEDMRRALLNMFTTEERTLQENFPSFAYTDIVKECYILIAQRLELDCDLLKAEDFAATIGQWPAYADAIASLRLLRKYYKVVTLPNVDDASFEETMRGPLYGARFDAVYTAEMIESYKPARENFEYLERKIMRDYKVPQHEVLIVSNNLRNDHVPGKKAGFQPGVWIERKGENGVLAGDVGYLLEEGKGRVELSARYRTLAEFAEAVDRAFKKKTKYAPSIASTGTSESWGL